MATVDSESSEARPMRIGELADRSGRTIRTLHFYEELGLLDPVSRTKGGFRLYDHHALLRIHWISRFQELGFSLPEIKEFLLGLHAQQHGPTMMGDLRAFYATKLAETHAAVKRLQALESELGGALHYLDGCRTCAPTTQKHTCRVCPDASHSGQIAPPLVAAVAAPPPQD